MNTHPYPTPPPAAPMKFGDAVYSAFQNYCNFSGRASRSEYWWFVLFNVLIQIILQGFGLAFNTTFLYILSYFAAIILFLPGLALSWRRLHDIGKAGGYYFIGLIPLVGTIILLVWLCKPSEPVPNRFGAVPGNTLR